MVIVKATGFPFLVHGIKWEAFHLEHAVAGVLYHPRPKGLFLTEICTLVHGTGNITPSRQQHKYRHNGSRCAVQAHLVSYFHDSHQTASLPQGAG